MSRYIEGVNRGEKMSKILIFDIEAEKARFKKEKTNNTTHRMPPRTTAAGIVAGMMGLPSYNYPRSGEVPFEERFCSDKCNIAVELMNEVEFFTDHENECLKSKAGNLITYRIYFQHEDKEIMEKLKERLETKNFVYQPSMGLRVFKAIIRYVGEFDCEEVTTDDFVKISTAIRQSDFARLKMMEGKADLEHKMVRDYDANHKPISSDTYLLSTLPLRLKSKTHYRIGDKNIVFM